MHHDTTWVEVKTSALQANLEAVRGYAGVPVCPVVKANAYGHGLPGTARIFAESGAEMIAVGRPEEVHTLRDSGFAGRILLMTPALDPEGLDCELTAASSADLERIPNGAAVHLKVDTGMGRYGFRPADVIAAATTLGDRAELKTIWTHFSGARGEAGTSQLERFRNVVEETKKAGLDCEFHAANSRALLTWRGSHFDMVRVGTLLYGENLSGMKSPFELQPAFTWYARTTGIRLVRRGEAVGYGGEWSPRRPTRVATLPIGYADGLTVQPFSRAESLAEAVRVGGGIALLSLGRRPSQRVVWFGDRPAPIVGRIAMQAISVSLEGLDDVEVGTPARIPARRLLVNPSIERVYV